MDHPTFKMDLKRDVLYTVETGYKIWQDGVTDGTVDFELDTAQLPIFFADVSDEETESAASFGFSSLLGAIITLILI